MTFPTRRRLPHDLIWDERNNTPAVMQLTVSPDVRITWNPDDDRFYVEQREKTYGDWETMYTRAGHIRGWNNAKYMARRLG